MEDDPILSQPPPPRGRVPSFALRPSPASSRFRCPRGCRQRMHRAAPRARAPAQLHAMEARLAGPLRDYFVSKSLLPPREVAVGGRVAFALGRPPLRPLARRRAAAARHRRSLVLSRTASACRAAGLVAIALDCRSLAERVDLGTSSGRDASGSSVGRRAAPPPPRRRTRPRPPRRRVDAKARASSSASSISSTERSTSSSAAAAGAGALALLGVEPRAGGGVLGVHLGGVRRRRRCSAVVGSGCLIARLERRGFLLSSCVAATAARSSVGGRRRRRQANSALQSTAGIVVGAARRRDIRGGAVETSSARSAPAVPARRQTPPSAVGGTAPRA